MAESMEVKVSCKLRHTSQSLLAKYIAHCGVCPAFGPSTTEAKPADEISEELCEIFDSDGEEEEFNDAPAFETSSDAKCFEVLQQMRAREAADNVEWQDIADGTADLNDSDEKLHLWQLRLD